MSASTYFPTGRANATVADVDSRDLRLDVAVALSFEVSPFLREGPEFDFRDNSQIPLRIALNTPLISSLVQFSSCDTALRIHPAVASILDDMRFLLAAVLALPESPSAKELQKVHTTSAWIHERISGLPEDSPAARRLSAVNSPFASRDSSAMPEGAEDQQHPLAGRGNPRPQQQQHHQQKQPRRPSAQSLSPEQPRAPSRSPPPPTATGASQSGPPDPGPDYVYQAVRQAALLYSRAIMLRRPFSQVVTPAEFLRLWTTAWRVPLSTWRSLLGVLNWILLPIVSCGKAAAAQPHDRFVKGMMNISLFQMGMDNWEIASAVMEAGLSLQRWLAGGVRESVSPPLGEDDGVSGGMGGEGSGGSGGGDRVGSGSMLFGERVGGGLEGRDVGKGKGVYGQINLGC